MTIDKQSIAQMIGEHRKNVRYRLGIPHTRPDGWVITLIAKGTSVQKAVCHDTGEAEELGAVEHQNYLGTESLRAEAYQLLTTSPLAQEP
jgi:hypothetical protein